MKTKQYPKSILSHPLWPSFRCYVKLISYNRDANKKGEPRWRFDFKSMPELEEYVPKVSIRCVTCRERIHPIRKYGNSSSYFLAVSCDRNQNDKCNHSEEASKEYIKIKEDCLKNGVKPIEKSNTARRLRQNPKQEALFEYSGSNYNKSAI